MAIYDEDNNQEDGLEYQEQLARYGLRRNTPEELEDSRRGASGIPDDAPRDAQMNQAARAEKTAGVQRAARQAKNRYSPADLAAMEKNGNPGLAGKANTAAGLAKAAVAPEAAVAGTLGKAAGKLGIGKLRLRKGGGRKGLAGVIGAGAAAAALAFFVWTYFPQHVNALLSFYDNKAFRHVIKNLDDGAENLWEHYIREHVLKALGPGCPNTRRDISCVQKLSGSSPPAKAINFLIGANSEGDFGKRTGIYFARDNQGRLFMTGPGLPSGGIDLKDFAEGKEKLFAKLPEVSQAKARQALKEALAQQTLFRRAFMRIQLRDIMKKYGVLRCVIACEARDNTREAYRFRKNAFKNYFFQRVLDPRNEGMRPAIACMFDPNCNPNEVVDHNGPSGAPRTKFEVELQNVREQLIAKGGNERKIKQIEQRANKYFSKGGKLYISELIFGEFIGKKITKAVPVYGWVTSAALIVSLAKEGGPKVEGINYDLIKSDMVGTYAMYRSLADEGRAGRVDETTMGSFSDSLTTRVADGNGNRSNAESTKVYEKALSQPGAPTAFFDSPLLYAAPTDGGGRFYRCNDGKPVPVGFLVCQEEYFRRGIEVLNIISNAIPDALAAVASGVNTIDDTLFGWVTGPIGDFLGHLGKWVGLDDLLEDLTRDAIDVARDYIFPNPVEYPTSGGRNGNLALGGAMATANDAAHYKLGGQVLSDPQYNDLQQAAIEDEQIQFAMLPLKDKLFDAENPHSLITRVALALPADMRVGVRDAFATIIINPFTKILQGLANLFTLRANADIATQANPWGDTTYGWRKDDPIFQTNPETYWDANCADGEFTKRWHEGVVRNEDTQQLENPTPNGCLLVEAVSESVTAKFQPITIEKKE